MTQGRQKCRKTTQSSCNTTQLRKLVVFPALMFDAKRVVIPMPRLENLHVNFEKVNSCACILPHSKISSHIPVGQLLTHILFHLSEALYNMKSRC